MASDKNTVSDKKTALDSAIKQIEKLYGKNAVMRLGANSHLNVASIPTGSLTLDIATGINGLPKGRIVEIYGPESSGKTTLALHCIAEAQKQGGEAAFIDAEHALDPVYAQNLGVDVDSLLVAQPDYGEQALEITEQLVRSNAVDIIVVDSVAALVPKTEIDGDMGDSHVGLHARLMSQALRKLTGAINKSNCLIIFINQLREKVGVLKVQALTLSATEQEQRLLKTSLHRLSNRLSLILCMVQVSAKTAKLLTLLLNMILLRRVVHGSLMAMKDSVRAEKRLRI